MGWVFLLINFAQCGILSRGFSVVVFPLPSIGKKQSRIFWTGFTGFTRFKNYLITEDTEDTKIHLGRALPSAKTCVFTAECTKDCIYMQKKTLKEKAGVVKYCRKTVS